MRINILAFGIPLFIGLILLEYYVARKKRLNYFNLHNAIANVSIGIAERLADILVTGAFFFVYDYVQKHYGLFVIKPSVFLWILLLLCTDFIWYWYHRLAHEVNILWAAHVVHHQSEDFNYTVSARITLLQAIIRTGFWSILSVIGFPASMITVMLLVHGIYPFFIHTRLIGNLGILEYIFVTPSHHRVHHASNEQYLDKNYGDVFIIWDKLFGTFQKENAEAPVYGLTHPLRTYSFLWQHFHFFIELWLAIKTKKTIKEKRKLLFGRPQNVDISARVNAEKVFNIKQNGNVIAKPLNRYVVWQMIVLLSLLFVFILFDTYFSISVKAIFVIVTLLTLINCGAIMEQKKWIFYIEVIRTFFILLILFYYSQVDFAKTLAVVLFFVFCIGDYKKVKNKYLYNVYKTSI